MLWLQSSEAILYRTRPLDQKRRDPALDQEHVEQEIQTILTSYEQKPASKVNIVNMIVPKLINH